MRFSTIISSALTAGLVLSAPLEKRVYTTDWVVEVVTSTTTVYPGAAAKPTGVPGAFLQGPPPPPTTEPAQAAYTPAPVQSSPPPPPPASKPDQGNPTTAPSDGTWQPIDDSKCDSSTSESSFDLNSPPSQCGRTWLQDINMWRAAYNKPLLSWSGDLAHSAYKAASAKGAFHHNDLGEIHAFGETMAGGSLQPASSNMHGSTPFGLILANGWLCEKSDDPQLQASGFTGFNVCGELNNAQAMTHDSTMHHDIFLGSYSVIGCAFSSNSGSGRYVCDYR